MRSAEIRQAFLNFFQNRGHQIVPSSSLVPTDDPTLLFTNAGMVQFKEIFLGLASTTDRRAASAQRCVRAGGKHNDLENVGYTARHHTFFEMLGNFSFGDYFKREAIQYAWTFLTQILKLPPEKLWVTVYTEDDETAKIWLDEMGLSPQRFSRCGTADNFWAMGDTGPCGPCTEIFYDHGDTIVGGPPGSPDADGDRYVEIWNIVFMQYNRDQSGQLHPLPKPSVDTGMGLERIAAVMQGVHSNYHTDTFVYLINAIRALKKHSLIEEHPSLNVIADHIRAVAFLIVDGVLPSHDGRGYVLRRIIRRAVRHGYQLQLKIPFFYQLVDPLIDVMGDAYPILIQEKQRLQQVIRQEEEQFSRTLEQGLKLLEQYLETSPEILSGDIVFKLYDTYGFPVDLTADIVRERGLSVDHDGFEACMKRQRLQSQHASTFQGHYHEMRHFVGYESVFKGYQEVSVQTRVLGLLSEQGAVQYLKMDDLGVVVLEETPFYAESGGQVGDRGRVLSLAEDMVFEVYDTQKIGQAIAHHGKVLSGLLSVGQAVSATIDVAHRQAIRLNHTATHLLHATLKTILGPHVEQKGSRVEAVCSRFDFSHSAPLTAQECLDIEACMNAKIRENLLVETLEMSLDDAKASGAQALFGEKYGASVRVLSMGDFSKELCGGTHASRTGDLGFFKCVAEYGVASSVRRLEFVTGLEACRWVENQARTLDHVAMLLKTTPQEVITKLEQQLASYHTLQTEFLNLKRQNIKQLCLDWEKEARAWSDYRILVKALDGYDLNGLRDAMDVLKSRLTPSVIVLVSVEGDKMHVLAQVSTTLIGKVPQASALVQCLCEKGGGRADRAQGGGPVIINLPEKMHALLEMIQNHG